MYRKIIRELNIKTKIGDYLTCGGSRERLRYVQGLHQGWHRR